MNSLNFERECRTLGFSSLVMGAQGGGAKDVAGRFPKRWLGRRREQLTRNHLRPCIASISTHSEWQRAVEAATRDMIDDLRSV